MSRRNEKIFFALTWLFQGPSVLNAVGYAIMHRLHHDHSDTLEDPHSPWNFRFKEFMKKIFAGAIMMWQTRVFYNFTTKFPQRFMEAWKRDYTPSWDKFEKFSESRGSRIFWVTLYLCVYFWIINIFDLSYFWLLLFLPHILMTAIQGFMVNWFGHKHGYQNFDNGDHSTNTLRIDVLGNGELYQNNHHKDKDDPNFARKFLEVDIVYQIEKILDLLGIIKLKRRPRFRILNLMGFKKRAV